VLAGAEDFYLSNALVFIYLCDTLLDIIDYVIGEACSHKYAGTILKSVAA
jgi:hypothetical protein